MMPCNPSAAPTHRNPDPSTTSLPDRPNAVDQDGIILCKFRDKENGVGPRSPLLPAMAGLAARVHRGRWALSVRPGPRFRCPQFHHFVSAWIDGAPGWSCMASDMVHE